MIGLALGLALAAPPEADCPGSDPAESAVDHFEAMLSGEGPEAELAFAECLLALDLPHAAQRHALEVVRRGRGSAVWERAVDRSMSLVDVLGDPLSPMAYLQGVQPRRVDAIHGRDALYLIHGQLLISEKRYELAAVRLEEVDPTGPWGPSSRLAQARALTMAGRREPALELYRSVPEGGPEGLEARWRTVDLLAGKGETDAALEALKALDGRPGPMVPAAVRARLLLEADRVDEASDALGAVDAAHRSGAWVPDRELMAAELAWRDCRVGRAKRHLDRFDTMAEPVVLALDTSAFVGSVDGRQLYTDWLGSDPVDHGLPDALRSVVLAPGAGRARIEGHLAEVERELALVPSLGDLRFQAIVAPHLDLLLGDGKERLRFLVGEGVGERLRELHADLRVHQATSKALRESLEVCDAVGSAGRSRGRSGSP